MPKDTSRRIIQRHFAPLTSRAAFRPEIKTKGPMHSSRIVYPLTEDYVPELPKALIPKPPGEVGRIKRNGYNLEKVLGWSKADYGTVQKSMRTLAQAHLDTTEILSKQKPKELKKVYKMAKDLHPRLTKYDKDWVIDDFLGMILKNSSTRQKRKAETPSRSLDGGKGEEDSESEGSASGNEE